MTAPLNVLAAGLAARPGSYLAPRTRGVVRGRAPGVPDPLLIDHHLDAGSALALMGALGQGIAFVSVIGSAVSVVTADDLEFARDWAGPRATVADAVTLTLVDLDPRPPTQPTQPTQPI